MSCFINELRRRLQQNELPGMHAFQMMMKTEWKVEPAESAQYRRAAVLILLHPAKTGHQFPLIRRSKHGLYHSGQVALPGGACENNESIEATALREATEEIGISGDNLEILGRLTPLAIPVSRYLVTPVVALSAYQITDWKINHEEVEDIFNVSVEDLRNASGKTDSSFFGNAPFFYLENQRVWGATAMMLSEFRLILFRADSGQ